MAPRAPEAAAAAGAVAVEHAVELESAPREALAAVAAAAEAWGADWQAGIDGGRLVLPVLAGIRHGTVAGRVGIEPRPGGGCRVGFVPEEARYALNTSAVAILVFATLGGLLTVLWPFYPRLLAAAPLGAVIALSGWFLVVSRLRTSGPDDFLALVAEGGAANAAEGEGG